MRSNSKPLICLKLSKAITLDNDPLKGIYTYGLSMSLYLKRAKIWQADFCVLVAILLHVKLYIKDSNPLKDEVLHHENLKVHNWAFQIIKMNNT